MRSIASIRGICSLGSGRRPPLFSSNSGSAQRPTYRTAAAMAEAAHDIDRPRLFGGIYDLAPGTENDPKYVELAQFAVVEHNTKANAAVEFERVVKVRGQLVSGTMHYLTIEAKEGGAKKLYEASVWTKVWEKNFKKLQEFKPAT